MMNILASKIGAISLVLLYKILYHSQLSLKYNYSVTCFSYQCHWIMYRSEIFANTTGKQRSFIGLFNFIEADKHNSDKHNLRSSV
jgi:hypothetical protein